MLFFLDDGRRGGGEGGGDEIDIYTLCQNVVLYSEMECHDFYEVFSLFKNIRTRDCACFMCVLCATLMQENTKARTRE